MGYIRDNLMANEKVLFSARVHPAVFTPLAGALGITVLVFLYGLSFFRTQTSGGNFFGIFLVFLSGLMLLYSILGAVKIYLMMISTEFAVTNRRVIAKTGFIRRHVVEILLSKVESISVQQSVIGRIFDYGTVVVTGTGGTSEGFDGIARPIFVRKKINQIVEGYMRAYAEYQQRGSSQRN